MLVEQAMLFDANDYRKAPKVTCGPYKFVSFENNMVKMELNDQYAGDFEGHKATIPNVIIQAINPEISVDLVKNGDIDEMCIRDRDEIDIIINGKDTKKFGSQGQQRSAILNIKLANVNLIENTSQDKAIILFDDVFSELDEKDVYKRQN